MATKPKHYARFKMVYIRNKKVKGIDYAYLVQSVWDPKRNMSRQQTIKYVGKASQITIEDIPEEYREDTKIMAFVSAFSSHQEERKILVSRIQEEIFAMLSDCNVNGLVDLYEKYSRLFGLTSSTVENRQALKLDYRFSSCHNLVF